MSAWTDTLHEPMLALRQAELDDLELLLGGLYGSEPAYSIPDPAHSPESIKVSLWVPGEAAQDAHGAGALLLTDADGTPLARLSITHSEDTDGGAYLAGPLSAVQPAEHPPARDIRLTSPLVSEGESTPSALLAVFSRAPRPHEIAHAVLRAKSQGATLWLLAVGARADDRALLAVVDDLRQCQQNLPNVRAGLLAVPRYGHPTGGPSGTVGEYILSRLEASEIMNFTNPDDFQAVNSPTDNRSGGMVVLMTGLSGSGKSTLARALAEYLGKSDRRQLTLLDGDDVRRFLTAGLGFSKADRNTNVERIGWVASLISKSGGIAVCAPIAPFETSRQRVREFAEGAGRYVLVHVSTPLAECEKRDRKGLYAKARAGIIPDFTGIDSPYEVPTDADYVVDTSITSTEVALEELLIVIEKSQQQ